MTQTAAHCDASSHPVSMPWASPQVMAYWEQRDLKSLPFANFMRVVLLDQIQRDKSSKSMSTEIGIDPKTYLAWVANVRFEAVILEALAAIAAKKPSPLSAPLQNLKETLSNQLGSLDRSVAIEGRQHAGLPSIEAFKKAMEHSVGTVLFRWAEVRVTELMALKRKQREEDFPAPAIAIPTPRDLAAVIADNLSWAYERDPIRDLHHSWGVLLKQAAVIGSMVTELALMRATAIPLGNRSFPVDLTYYKNVRRKFRSESKILLLKAHDYFKAMDQLVREDDLWSEKSSLQFPLILLKDESSDSIQKRLDRVNKLIHAMKLLPNSIRIR